MNKGDRVIKIRLNYKEYGALEYVKNAYGGGDFSNEDIAKNILINHISLALKQIEEKVREKTRPANSAEDARATKESEAPVRNQIEGPITNGEGINGTNKAES